MRGAHIPPGSVDDAMKGFDPSLVSLDPALSAQRASVSGSASTTVAEVLGGVLALPEQP